MRPEKSVIVVWFAKRCRALARALGSIPDGVSIREARFEQAYTKLRAAYAHGEPSSECFVGFTHLFGPGRQNAALGAKWFLMGAHRGDRACQWFLGELFATGLGVPRNLVQAYIWTARAASDGPAQAAVEAAALKRRLAPEELVVAAGYLGGSCPHSAGLMPRSRVIELLPLSRSRASAA